jgi:hypothetical protein
VVWPFFLVDSRPYYWWIDGVRVNLLHKARLCGNVRAVGRGGLLDKD